MCSVPDYESLKSLAHTSASYHQAYLKAQRDILHHVAMHTLCEHGIGLLDPWTAIHAPHLEATASDRKEKIDSFLENYGRGQIGDSTFLDIEESLAILALDCIFGAIVGDYCRLNLTDYQLTMTKQLSRSERLASYTPSQSEGVPQPSKEESQRLYRALWRWEIYSKLFSVTEINDGDESNSYALAPKTYAFHDVDDIAEKFLCLFPVHEIEELACLNSYARYCYVNHVEESSLDYIITRGPAFLNRLMRTRSIMEQDQLLRSEVEGIFNTSMPEVLLVYEWTASGGSWPRKLPEAPMKGPAVVESVPNDGWLWASSRGIQNTDYKLRRWGYVFWSRRRLDEWGIKEEDMHHW